jgi:hypothetical protein
MDFLLNTRFSNNDINKGIRILSKVIKQYSSLSCKKNWMARYGFYYSNVWN